MTALFAHVDVRQTGCKESRKGEIVRKCLGVSAAVALLCAISWAQSPTQTPTPGTPPSPGSTSQSPATQQPTPPAPDAPVSQQPIPESTKPAPLPPPKKIYPLTELFVGYSLAQAGFFNAGHWAQLNGWDASFGLNAAPWIGFVFDASEYFGTSQIPRGAPAPFPNCTPFCPSGDGPTFGADTREYNLLFGAQFPYRKHELLTPFGEIMFGHDGVRGIAQALPPAGYTAEASSGLALLAGAGVDRKINERFAIRLKADYLESKTAFPLIGKAKQDNIRVSVGIVIRNVKKKKRRLEDETGVEQ